MQGDAVDLMASQPSVIDILIVIDADTIVASYPPGSADNPTSIDLPLIFMIVRQGEAVFGNGGKELKISASIFDEIRWRETSLSLNAENFGLLYSFFALRGDPLLSTPTPMVARLQTPLPNPSDPLHPTTQTVQNYFWSTTLLQAGSVTYAFRFMVLDRNGAVQGYYYWDPFITIAN